MSYFNRMRSITDPVKQREAGLARQGFKLLRTEIAKVNNQPDIFQIVRVRGTEM